MAEKRMVSRQIISADKFTLLPVTAQLLYFHLVMNADDDGFIDRVTSIQRTIGVSPDDVTKLDKSGFIHIFESGIAVDMFWNVNNSVRKDRYKPTIYQKEFNLLVLDAEGKYNLKPTDNQVTTNCQPTDNQVTTQVSIVEDRLEEDRIAMPREANQNSAEVNEAIQFFLQKVPLIVNPEKKRLAALVQRYGITAFKEAVTIMQKRGGRSMAYLEKVIKDPRPDAPPGDAELSEEVIRSVLG